ncbi:hypothetical protein SJI00_03685 [Pseudomonas sp. RP23018S]|uniref:hypothetical protein n=1 Tax=Pseudomonas sp. RP23018S TaxID=3096037 RepID=UPI002ACAE475|nr:hypothetical protein [Pseudomonas sp. RP23018S]MDZ5601879.1 hypothetical protein [Pseudomonas sp. RP23018S]
MEFLRRIALVLCLGSLGFAAQEVRAAQPVAPAPVADNSTTVKAPAKAAVKPKATAKAKAKQSVTRTRASSKRASKAAAKAAAASAKAERLDLSLPKSVNMDYKPDLDNEDLPGRRAPLLPAMFPDTPTTNDNAFQLNGRLISNEMQLQLRNESRRDLEGAAIEFQFRQ